MFKFTKTVFVAAVTFFGYNVLNANSLNEIPLKCVSVNS